MAVVLELGLNDMADSFDAVVPDTGEIVTFEGRQLVLPGRVHHVGLELPADLSFEQWSGIGSALQDVNRSLMWWIGDWLRYGERRWGEMYAQAVEETGKAYDTVRAAKWVAEQFSDDDGSPDFVRRRTNLSWAHHREVAGLSREEQDELLDDAERNTWGHKELRAEISRRKARAITGIKGDTGEVTDLHEAVRRGMTFGAIYADPPWLYDNQSTRASTGNHYGGMTVDELCELPVRELAAGDAHLHLWTTNAFLFECPRIFEAWGFEFRSSFVWCKPKMGIGNYWRNSHEILLTAIRGDAKRFSDKNLWSWLECDRGRHSAKPEQVRGFIERASPGPYLELFARSPARGWSVWGNEVERGLLFQDVPEVA